MKVSDAELEYREKYAYLPSTQSELIEYLEKNLKLDKNKIEAEEEKIKSIQWERVFIEANLVPHGSPRPRYSSVTGTFYVKGTKKMKRFFEKIIQEHMIICTRVEYTLRAYMPTPTSTMNNTEIYLAEKGLILPISTSDWDNLAKTYTDCLQDILLLNDNIINPGHVYKYYSIKPRIEIEIRYQVSHDSKYNKRKTESTVAYKKMIESGYEQNNGVLRKDEKEGLE